MRKGGYRQALGDGGDVPLGRLEASSGGRRSEFDCSRRNLGGLRHDGSPVNLCRIDPWAVNTPLANHFTSQTGSDVMRATI